MANQAQRNELVALMNWCWEKKALITYPPNDVRTTTIHEIRTVNELKTRVENGLQVDCSQMVTALLLAVGCKNPNGGDTDGYTGTLLSNLPHYSDPRGAYSGALVVFGPGTGHHVAMVLHRDTVHGNPVIFSHGSNEGPDIEALSVERAVQNNWGYPGIRMLSIADL